jgi:uncharacterized paraquat-inducible protein A
MARKSTMNPLLKSWLNQEVYPKLSHDQVFGNLPNYTKAQYSETRYGDCPRCHRTKHFFMIDGRPTGTCDRCHVVITWWSFLKFDHTESETIATIAALAGVPPIDLEPDEWVRL